MAKTRRRRYSKKNRHNKKYKKALNKTNQLLYKIGQNTENITRKSLPIVEKGVSFIYNTMAKGAEISSKGVSKLSKITHKRTTRRHK